MNNSAVKTGFSFFLLLFATILFFLTIELGRIAALVPIKVVIPTLVLLVFQLVLDLVPGLAQKFSRFEKVRFVRSEQHEEDARLYFSVSKPEESLAIRERRAFTWILLLLLLIYIFGLTVSVPLYTCLYIKRRAEEGWLYATGMAAGMCIMVYGIFVLILGIRLYEGVFWTWMGF